VGKTIEIEMTVKVKVKLPLSGASAGELALAIGPVRNEIGRELMRLTVESVQETIVGRERLPRRAARHGPWKESSARCRCTSFTKQGWRARGLGEARRGPRSRMNRRPPARLASTTPSSGASPFAASSRWRVVCEGAPRRERQGAPLSHRTQQPHPPVCRRATPSLARGAYAVRSRWHAI
jgi:hypothetical protein